MHSLVTHDTQSNFVVTTSILHPGLLLGIKAPVKTPTGVDFPFLFCNPSRIYDAGGGGVRHPTEAAHMDCQLEA